MTDRLPPAVDDCKCLCHRRPGIKHFFACCGLGSLRKPKERPVPDIDKKLLEASECFITFARRNIGFRYGPFTAEEAGQIIMRCNDEHIPAVLHVVGGREIDWELAAGWARGEAQVYKPEVEAPRDGTVIIAPNGDFEVAVVWWANWETWRRVNDDGSMGPPVDVFSWRLPGEGDLTSTPSGEGDNA